MLSTISASRFAVAVGFQAVSSCTASPILSVKAVGYAALEVPVGIGADSTT